MTMETTIESKLRTVAEYDGWFPNGAFGYTNHTRPEFNVMQRKPEQMEYDSSWDWLNPVWAKARKDLSETWSSSEETQKIIDLRSNYHSAVDTDNVAEAFEVVVKAIELLKELKGN